MTNLEYAQSLRRVADFFETHPDIPAPHDNLSIYVLGKDLPRIARQLGTCEKIANGTFFNLRKDFGPIIVEFFSYRDQVCERVSKGKKLVPETVIPAKPEEIIAAHEVEEFEWKCPDSFLSAQAVEAAGERNAPLHEANLDSYSQRNS